ncbi:hypothetical protein B0T19DRAFT_41502 [Cercophora scortea]|uniref:Uncharacterized protein n=1 Tax=Cercophora scortea TaxID=314031 RepID=A0AAE0J4Q1_9PEZI|nr:hypothetical protein B0T19DRAFT_41502 [Cercophora scortea]
MASYDGYEAPSRERSARRYYREERREDPRIVDPRDNYLTVQSHDLVPRPRQDSDLSVESIRRDFPPPGYGGADDIRRSRSAGAGYRDDYDDRRSYHGRDRDYDRDYDRDHDRDYDRDHDRRTHKKGSSSYYEEEEKKKARMLSKQEQIIAAITGAALAIGGKELYDRREASQHGKHEVDRNVLTSAALGAAGALAGYQGTELYNKHKEKEEKKSLYVVHKGRDGRVSEYYSEDEESVKDKKSHNNFLEKALAAAGLGGAVKALTGGSSHKDDRSDTRSRRGSRSSSRSRGRGDGANKIQKAAMASLIAGATEAFRVSKEPGSWKGEKAKRIITAAATAATIDAAQNPDKAGSKMGLAESVIGGLLGNRMLNGSKKDIEEDEKTGRSRSRSRARSSSKGRSGGGTGLAALATAGLATLGAKKLVDHRSRSRSRRRSVDSRDSRDASPEKRHRSRSRSVVDSARRGLAKIGLGNGPDDDDRDRRDRKRDDYDDSPRRHGRHDDSDYSDREKDRSSRRGGGRDDYDDDRSYRGGARERSRSRQRSDRGTVTKRRDGSASSSDLGDSDEDEKRAKKMRGKQILTTGLAAVATIHAAHNVYQSVEKRKKRQKAVNDGTMSTEDAKKLRKRALWQDAASVGIAALGIKGAISELKEVRETTHEMHEWQEKRAERHKRRLERLQRLKNRGGDSDSDSDGGGGGHRRWTDNSSRAAPPRAAYDDGPRYVDGNPYAALPPPPAGYSSDRR